VISCHVCDSEDLEFIESHADSAVVGGFVRVYRCADCNARVEVVPPEIYDEKRDREIETEAESR